MSTNSECQVIEYQPGAWYYLLEYASAPKNSWDWREYADAYGPFESKEAALENLGRNHANPGGHEVLPYDPEHSQDELLARKIAKAYKPTPTGGVSDGRVTHEGPFVYFHY